MDLMHHAMHVMGSRILGFSQELFDDTASMPDDEAIAMSVQLADHYPNVAAPVREIPGDVRELADRGFDTVVRVPLDGSHIETVRRALDEVSDEIVLLLDSFEQVVIEDRRMGTRHSVSRVTVEHPREAEAGVWAEHVEIRRNGAPTSTWRLYRQILSPGTGLEGEITMAVPFEVEGETSSLLR
jgi:hypothetical protein